MKEDERNDDEKTENVTTEKKLLTNESNPLCKCGILSVKLDVKKGF